LGGERKFAANHIGVRLTDEADVIFPLLGDHRPIMGRANWIKKHDFILTMLEALEKFLETFPNQN
jgi:hypothetical protein